MSKYVKDLVTQDIARRLQGVEDAVLVNVVGLNSLDSYNLRKELRQKNIHLLVVRRSLAARATEGTKLAAAFGAGEGSLAVVWGSDDFVSLCKEVTALHKSGKYKQLETRGGVMDGERLAAERLTEIAKWPNRQQQVSLLVGQILAPGANLSAQLLGPGAKLLSQIKKKSEGAEDEPASEAAAEAAPVPEAAAPEAPAAEAPAAEAPAPEPPPGA